MSETVELVLEAQARLGEGAIWDAQQQLLYWVNILENKVYIYDPASRQNRSIDVGQYVGTVVPRQSGGLMLALHHGFASLDLETEQVTIIADPEAHLPDNRFNDGKCDPAGRFWAGTMPIDGASRSGSLYRLDPDHSVHRMVSGVTISNGLVWTADRRTMYYIDTPNRTVDAFAYDLDSGAISQRRVAVTIPEGSGGPDGMAIDSEDMIWVAHWGGSRVTRWNPVSGELLQTIEVPALQVTSCAFGGPELNELYITSARNNLNPATLAKYPLSGGLFRVKLPVTGVAANAFAG
jgi:sugar lactone lactonase YvrE